MSWDIVSKAVETVIANALFGITRLGPMLPLSPGPDTDGQGPEHGGGDASPAPDVPGQPAPPPPPAPPVPPEGAEGPAAEAAKEEARRVGEMLEQLVELDSAGISAEEVAAAGEVGRQELENIRADVMAKIEQMKADGSLYTVEGQKALMDFVKTRLEEARTVIEKAAADSEDKAAVSQDNATRYSGVGTAPDGSAGADGGSANDAAVEADSTQEEAQTTPAGMLGQPGMGMGMPLGGGMPMGGLPGFGGGGGGLPGFGGGGLPTGFTDPLASTLAGFSDQQPAEEAGPDFTDEEASPAEEAGPDFTEDQAPTETDAASESDPEEESAQTQAAAADQEGQQAETVEPTTKSTDVQLPDNSVTEARTAQGAEAVRSALNGTPVAEAWQQAAGVTLPPAGTPMTDPVPPTQLKAGDVGMWKDHLVMALGDGKVLVSGQVQPLESVSSGPDFLGWFDPTATNAGSPAPAPAAD